VVCSLSILRTYILFASYLGVVFLPICGDPLVDQGNVSGGDVGPLEHLVYVLVGFFPDIGEKTVCGSSSY